MSKTYDLVGIGNAIVDVIAHGDDPFLADMGIEKGIMQLIDRDRAETLYGAMQDRVQTAGGSVANTIAGAASLGLATAFLGKVKDDGSGPVLCGRDARRWQRFSPTRLWPMPRWHPHRAR